MKCSYKPTPPSSFFHREYSHVSEHAQTGMCQELYVLHSSTPPSPSVLPHRHPKPCLIAGHQGSQPPCGPPCGVDDEYRSSDTDAPTHQDVTPTAGSLVSPGQSPPAGPLIKTDVGHQLTRARTLRHLCYPHGPAGWAWHSHGQSRPATRHASQLGREGSRRLQRTSSPVYYEDTGQHSSSINPSFYTLPPSLFSSSLLVSDIRRPLGETWGSRQTLC